MGLMQQKPEANKETIDSVFGERFADARKSTKVSQETVVAELSKRGYELPLTAIGKIERGQRRVTVGEAAALADALGFTLDALVNRQGLLLSSWAIVGRERDALMEQAKLYVDALIDLAKIADSGESHLRDRDIESLTRWLEQETPALSTSDSLVILEARLAREGLNQSGRFLQILLQSLKSESESLVELRAKLRDD
jgi:transcriptional regulator with XRE-family HTH domain